MNFQFLLKRFGLITLLAFSVCAKSVGAEYEYEEESTMAVDPALAVPYVKDLEALGAMSQQTSVPILIMYAQEDCDYCARLESEVLGPLRLSGSDPKRVLMRKVMMEEYEYLRDFTGKERTADTYAVVQGVEVAPTVALVDQNGKELVPKIVGYQTPGIYEKFLLQAINTSQKILEQR